MIRVFVLTKSIDDLSLNSYRLKSHSAEPAEEEKLTAEQRAEKQIDALVITAELSTLSYIFYQIPSHGVVWNTVQQSGVHWDGKVFDFKPLLAS